MSNIIDINRKALKNDSMSQLVDKLINTTTARTSIKDKAHYDAYTRVILELRSAINALYNKDKAKS